MSKNKKITGNDLSLQELLNLTDHEKLVEILITLHESSDEFQKQLDIVFAGLESSPKKIISMIKKEISSLKRSSRFLEMHEAQILSERLNNLRLRIANDLKARDADVAFKMMLDFLDLHEKTLERLYDKDNIIRNIFILACEDLGKIAEHVKNTNLQEMIEIIFTRFMRDLYYVHDNIIYNFKNILQDHGLELLKKRFEQSINGDNLMLVKSGLKSIADCQNNVDQYIDACLFQGTIFLNEYLEIAERFIKHWESQKALKWLDDMDIYHNHPLEPNRKYLKIQALELEGNYGQAQEERIEWFERTLNPEIYGEILSAANDDFKEKFRQDAIKIAFQFPEPHMGLAFLLEIQEFEELAKFIYEKSDKLDGSHYYLLRPAAELLKKIAPFSATILYRKMIKPILDKAKSKYYNYAAKDLVMCNIISKSIIDWKHLQNHEEYFNEIVTKHSRKMRFWSEYESALKKEIKKMKTDTL